MLHRLHFIPGHILVVENDNLFCDLFFPLVGDGRKQNKSSIEQTIGYSLVECRLKIPLVARTKMSYSIAPLMCYLKSMYII